MISQKLKLVSAAVGAGAVAVMGAFTIALSTDSGSTSIVSDPEMTLGETSTVEKAATSVETPSVAPEVTAEPPDGFGP